MAKRKSSDEAEITDEEKQAALDDADALIDETWADTNGNVKLMFKGVVLYLHGLALRQRNLRKQLEDRVAELEKSPLDWKGIWAPGSFDARSCVTHGGSCWYTPRKTKAKPGEGIDWVMIVKGAR